MAAADYQIISKQDIILDDFHLPVTDIVTAAHHTNQKFLSIYTKTKAMHVDVFSVIDFRVLSGMMGEVFSTELCKINSGLTKNPNLDGYPDLLLTSSLEQKMYFHNCSSRDFIKYKYGGLEVKNTFGTKKSGSFVLNGDQRILDINKKLDWKAHHRTTNYLVALYSDYLEQVPRIAAVFYSDTLVPEDWTEVQRPKLGSGMTSFSNISSSGFNKIISGLKVCLSDEKYLSHFSKRDS